MSSNDALLKSSLTYYWHMPAKVESKFPPRKSLLDSYLHQNSLVRFSGDIDLCVMFSKFYCLFLAPERKEYLL